MKWLFIYFIDIKISIIHTLDNSVIITLEENTLEIKKKNLNSEYHNLEQKFAFFNFLQFGLNENFYQGRFSGEIQNKTWISALFTMNEVFGWGKCFENWAFI